MSTGDRNNATGRSAGRTETEGKFSDSNALRVPSPLPPSPGSLANLVTVMEQLRRPDTGCPWDLEQSFATIAPFTIEEAYEVADAISRQDLVDLKEELGDLLLQGIYHAQMAREVQAFDIDDVIEAITAKMIRRHPHVFGTAEARAAGPEKGFWEKIKADERRQKHAERLRLGAAADEDASVSVSLLDDVAVALPALTRAVKLQERAARVGFDWPSVGPVLGKIREELSELEAEIPAVRASVEQAPDARPYSPAARLVEEYGDLLFVVANLARHLRIDPETALAAANAKFVRRFRYIEERLAEMAKKPEQSNLAEMDELWNETKSRER